MKKWKRFIIAGMMALLLFGPVQGLVSADFGRLTAKAAGIRLNYKKLTLVKGQKKALKVAGTRQKAQWSSSRRSVAAVNSKGTVTAKKKGSAAITAKIKGRRYQCRVTVETPVLNARKYSLYTGKSVNLRLKGTKRKAKWSSSNKKVAVVSSLGKVTGKAAGSATITASLGGKRYRCSLKVLAPKNDTMGQARSISFGATVNDSITVSTNQHYYKVSLAQAGRLQIDMTSYMKYYCIKVIGMDGKEIWYTDHNEWTETLGYRRDTHNVYLEQGSYYIQVNGYSYGASYKSTGKYTFKTGLQPSGVTNKEPDNSFSSANALSISSATVTGQISVNDDFDDYKFTLPSSGRISIKITSYMENYCMRLFDSSGEEVWYTDYNPYNGNIGYRTDTYGLELEKGLYYMQVNGYRNAASYKSTGKYTFTTAFVNANATNKEPDNSFTTGNTIQLGKLNRGQIAINDNYDNYKMNLSYARKISIKFKSYMQYYCIYIYDAEGNEVWKTDYNEWNGNVGFCSDSYEVELSAGSYYVQVDGYEWEDTHKSTGNYEFTIS